MNETILEVLKVTTCALNHQTYDKSLTDERAFYMLALENGLSALVHKGLNQKLISDKLKQMLQRNFYDYVARDTKQQLAVKRLDDILNEHQIDHIFLKGTMLKKLYPETYLRGMGDIDILVKAHEMKHVHEVFKKEKIICTSRSKQHDVFQTEDELLVEIHPMLYKDFNKKYEHLFSDPWKYAKLEKNHLYIFEHEFEIVYLLYHLAKHMDSSGIGLRSVLDIGIYFKAYEAKMNEEVLKSYLLDTEMLKFFSTMIEVNQRYFGFDFKLNLTNLDSMDEKLFNELTDYLVRSGIHGQGRDFNPFEARMASYELHEKSRFRMIINLIFPSYDSVKAMYPYVAKARILIIFGWIQRWIKLIFRKTKSTLKKIGKLFVKKDSVNKSKELFEKIGLK
jgi:hypothetical protein